MNNRRNHGRDMKGTLINSLTTIKNQTDVDVSRTWEDAQRLLSAMEGESVHPVDKSNLMRSLVLLRYDLSKLEMDATHDGNEEVVTILRRSIRRVKRLIKMVGKTRTYDALVITPVNRPVPNAPGIELITDVICKMIDIPEEVQLSLPMHHVYIREMQMSDDPQSSSLWRIVAENRSLRLEVYDVHSALNCKSI